MRKYILTLFIVFVACYGCASDQPEPSVQQVDQIYTQCSGTTFYPVATPDIPSGLATRVFDEWKSQFVSQHGLSDRTFDSRIKLSAVELAEGPSQVFVRIDSVFVMDWVRSRQAASIDLGTYPLAQVPSDSAISRAVRAAIRPSDQVNLRGVVSRATAENALGSCCQSMEPDWCHIRFENVTGRLLLWGRCTIDSDANKCKEAAVDLSNGNLVYCQEEPCVID